MVEGLLRWTRMQTSTEPGRLPPRVLETRFFCFETAEEVYEIFRPAPDVAVVRVVGHSCTEAAVQAAASLEREFGDAPFTVFVDFTALLGYEPKGRRVIASWVTAHAKQVKTGWFCTSSRVVQMGVSVGSMVVSMVGVHIHAVGHDEWIAALLEAIDDGGPADS